MPAKEVSMRKIRELLRLHFSAGLSQHHIAASLQLSVGVINKYVRLAESAELSWPLPSSLNNDIALKQALVTSKALLVLPIRFYLYWDGLYSRPIGSYSIYFAARKYIGSEVYP